MSERNDDFLSENDDFIDEETLDFLPEDEDEESEDIFEATDSPSSSSDDKETSERSKETLSLFDDEEDSFSPFDDDEEDLSSHARDEDSPFSLFDDEEEENDDGDDFDSEVEKAYGDEEDNEPSDVLSDKSNRRTLIVGVLFIAIVVAATLFLYPKIVSVVSGEDSEEQVPQTNESVAPMAPSHVDIPIEDAPIHVDEENHDSGEQNNSDDFVESPVEAPAPEPENNALAPVLEQGENTNAEDFPYDF